MNEELERSFAEAAFFWVEYGYYGSESKAVTAFRRRKGMHTLTRDFVRERLLAAAAVVKHVVEERNSIPGTYEVQSLWNLGHEQHEEARHRLCATLAAEYPSLPVTVSYVVAMAWDMPYVR